MDISSPCVVALTWTLTDTLGEELDRSDEPVEFLVGGGQDLLPIIEEALQDQTAGVRLQLQIEPEHGFGDFNDQLILLAPRASLPPKLETGQVIEGHALSGLDGVERDTLYVVSDLYPEHVVLDGNHPLAGIAIRLALKIEAVRTAEPTELAAGRCGSGFFRWQVDAPPPCP